MDDKLITVTISIPKPNRRWLQISLATFLLLTLVAGVWIGGFRDSLKQFWNARTISRSSSPENLKIAQELSVIIRKMSGIENAYVRYKRSSTGVTADVSVWPKTQTALVQHDIDSIRQLVSNSVGSNPDDVSVFDMVAGKQRR